MCVYIYMSTRTCNLVFTYWLFLRMHVYSDTYNIYSNIPMHSQRDHIRYFFLCSIISVSHIFYLFWWFNCQETVFCFNNCFNNWIVNMDRLFVCKLLCCMHAFSAIYGEGTRRPYMFGIILSKITMLFNILYPL